MIEASLLSLFGVACLFVAGFGGLRHPLMAVATLLVAHGLVVRLHHAGRGAPEHPQHRRSA